MRRQFLSANLSPWTGSTETANVVLYIKGDSLLFITGQHMIHAKPGKQPKKTYVVVYVEVKSRMFFGL
jgi:hypothetical protein